MEANYRVSYQAYKMAIFMGGIRSQQYAKILKQN